MATDVESRGFADDGDSNKPTLPSPLDTCDVMPTSRKILANAIADALLMVSYAAYHGVSLDKDTLSKIIAADQAERDHTLTQQQESEFWLAAAVVAHAILPVTPESLRCSVSHGEHSAAGVAARKYRIRTIITLVTLLLFQVYWLIGATILADIEEITGRLTGLSVEFDEANREYAQLNPKDANHLAEQKALVARLDAVNGKIWIERIKVATDFNVLKNWNAANALLLWSRTSQPSSEKTPSQSIIVATDDFAPVNATSRFLWEFTPETVAQVQTARIALATLLLYVLPILYGALGASAFIVRTLAEQIKATTYTTESDVGYQLRFYLGAVAGLSIAWFTSDQKGAESAGILPSLSPLALAFVAGFSVELLFSLLERVVGAFSVTEPKASK